MAARETPPRLARRLLTGVIGRSIGGRGIVVELDDEFADRATLDRRKARWWYRREAAGVIARARALNSPGDPFMRRIAADLRQAIRSLARQPRFALLSSLTLALGVGAVTVIFSLVNGVLLTPLPYPHVNRLVNVWSHSTKMPYDQFAISPDLYLTFERETSLFDAMAISQTSQANLTGSGSPDVLDGLETTRSYFDTLGIQPALGRVFSAVEDSPTGSRVVVLSNRAWRNRFGADPGIVGRSIELDGAATDVVGVMPASIDEKGSPDFFLPARLDRANPIKGSFGWNAIARLAVGVTPASAASRLTAVANHYGETVENPAYRAFLQDGTYNVVINHMKDDLIGDLQRPLWILLGTVGMLLAIACANVANLFLVRAEGRQLEIAVRSALGGRRAALVRGIMAEALVLAAAGSAIGVAAAAASLPALLRLAPPSIPRLDLVTVDVRVVLFSVAVAALSAMVFGLIPALRYTRPTSMAVLRQGGRGGTSEPARRRARGALVVLQTAIAVVLLVGSGLLARSFARLGATDPGFDPRDVMTFHIALPASAYPDDAHRATFVRDLTEHLAALPGVQSSGAVTELPFAGSISGTAHEFEGQPIPAGQLPPIVHYASVSGNFFTTMRIPLVRGRFYNSGDYAADARTVIVNQALADERWPGQDPVGRRVRSYSPDPDKAEPWYTVVGVVGSVRDENLRRAPSPMIYYAGRMPADRSTPATFAYVVRGAGLATRTADLRATVWALDPSLPVAAMQPMTSLISVSIVEFTFTMLTLGIASVLALALGSIGLYGVLSYAVLLETREIGVRLALGATPGVVMRAVVLNGMLLSTIGLAIGLAAAWGLTRYMSGLLFEITPLDPPTFVGMSVAMLFVAFLASYLPARRAAGVSPLESMKAT